jgi:hypothetical protein
MRKKELTMKKMLALIIAALLALSTAAFAETYRSDDINFEYDENAFEVTLDDRTDDETTVVLHGKNEAWGNTFISFYLRDLEDGEKLPTMEEMSQIPDTTVTQGDWNGYKDVFMYTLENDDGTAESYFIAPVKDKDDKEIEDVLTVHIGTSKIEDEAVLQERDDAISAVVDSLKVDD